MRKYLYLLIPLIMLLLPLKGYAQEKEMSVNLTSEYTQATFHLEFETEQTYTVVITHPSGLTHETTIEGSEGSISISDIEDGEYKLTITAEEDIVVKSRVEAKKTEVQTNPKDINVSTVVSGLKIYFKNTDLCIEWDENANEDTINVEVIEPTSMQVLDSKKVTNTFYTLDFDESFNKLEIYLVPSRSSNVEGAGTRFTIDVVLDNKGRVIFPETTLYNISEYTFDVKVIDNMRVFVDEDNKIVYDQVFNEAGDYQVTIPLNDMKNHITVWCEDSDGNLNSFLTTIDRDIEAPIFSVNPFDTVTKDSSINISGSVTESKSVMFNDFEVMVDEYGRFTFDAMLIVGDNKITLTAYDDAGNETTVEYIITRKEVNYIPLIIIFGIGIFSLLIGTVLKKKREFAEKESPKTKEKKEPKKPKEKPKKEPKAKKKRANSNMVNDYLSPLPILVLGIFLIITGTVAIKNTVVASASMEPTLKTGSICIINKLAYKNKPIQRGDIVCFYSTQENAIMTKRVVGVAGDEISFKDGFLILNGEKAIEEYLDEDIETNSSKTFIVPDGSVFLLGDNREDSYDSRFWENPFVSTSHIYGKYLGDINL